jgi:uncharacterized protein YggE
MNEINKAKQVLREAGYYVDNLWSIHDVRDDDNELTDEQKMQALDMALTNEYTTEQMFNAIGVSVEIITNKIK